MTDNAAVKALEEKVAQLEAKVDPQKRKNAAPSEPSLAECNAVYNRAQAEILEDKRDSATLAKKAIDEVFRGGKRARVHQVRIQKNLSPVGAELASAAAKTASK